MQIQDSLINYAGNLDIFLKWLPVLFSETTSMSETLSLGTKPKCVKP